MNLRALNFLKGKGNNVTVTSINVKLHGYMHSLKGMDAKEKEFTVEIPFKNKTHTDMLTDAASFKSQKAEPINIKGIEVSGPFKLLGVEPKLPYEVKADEKMTLKLTVESQVSNYTGPMNISLASDEVEMVHIEISKTVLDAKGRKVEIETSSRILNVPKGQIFSEKIQLYKAFSYGDAVSSIELSTPFKFVSSDPKLPLKVDDPNSYILNIYIQAPPDPYAGKLEIKLS
ncbi:MAG: hypothetical protein ACREBH_00865 [Candidatus Micrarchaeaceae archaeon]